MNYTNYIWRILALVTCFHSLSASAYEYGFVHVPKELEPLRQQLIVNPRVCLKQIEQKLEQQKSLVHQTIETKNITLLSNQIGALCAYRIDNIDLAQHYINLAIGLAQEQQHQAHLTQAYIVAALILSEDPNRSSEAESFIELASVNLEKLKIFPLPNMRFQLQKVIARFMQNQGKSNEAKNYLLKAKEEAYTSKSVTLRAWSEALLANYYLTNNQPELALNHLSEADLDDLAKPTSESLFLSSKVKANIAKVYLDQGELAIAEQFQQDAIAHAVELGNPDLQAEEIATLANMAELSGDIDAALVHYLNAKDIAKSNGNIPLLAQIELRLGQTYMEFSDYTPALVHLQIARQLFNSIHKPNEVLRSLLLLGELHISNQENGLAILQLEKAEALANTMGLTSSHSKVYKLLTQAYEKNGNYALALEQFKIYHSLNQQYQQIRNELKREQFKQHYQYIEQAQRLSDLTREKAIAQQQSSFQQLILVLVCVFGIMLLFLFLVTRQKLLLRNASVNGLTQQLNQHPVTGWQQLAHCDAPLNGLPSVPAPSANSTSILLLLSIELLKTESQHTLGFEQRRILIKDFVDALMLSIEENYQLGHVNDQQMLLRIEQHQRSPQQLCEQLMLHTQKCAQQLKIEIKIAIGTCVSPFLTKAKDAIDDKGMTEVVWLALEGAQQLYAHTQTNQWVELTAMSGSHAAFFCTNVTQDVKQAITKGLVKVNASADKNLINW
ncbi:tetratricopeptide repeat protein [Agarivorans sp. MS3-6]